MPKILIVDDEAIFRKGLRSMISALDPEWDIVGDARDGYEALDLLEKLKPDVILSDIRMPRMDGIQLQKIARERFPHVACVVISGYEDFTYVKESMRHGAKDYLMKPVEREELGKVLERLKKERLLEAGKQSQSHDKEEQQLRRRISEHFIAALHRRSFQASDLLMLKDIGIQFDAPYFSCLVIKLDKESVGSDRYLKADPSLFQLYIQQFVQEVLDHRTKGFSFIFSDLEVVALVNLPDDGPSKRRLLEIAESIRLQMKSLSRLTVTIGVGRCAEGAESIPRTYSEAEIALLYRLIVGGDKVLEYESTVLENRLQAPETKKWSWDALEKTINEGRSAEIGERVENAVSDLIRHAQNPETVHQHICKLLIQYYELSEDIGFTKDWLGQKDIRTLLFDICSISSSEELTEECRRLLGRLTACIAAGNSDVARDPVMQSLKFLEGHFHEPLTLKDVADRVYLNPAYFSTLFKQRTGKSFIERLTELRVAAAKKRLASTNEKMTAIAENTGFANIRHFNRVFKKVTGVSPKDFRDEVRSAGDGPG